jgi:acetyl-CoA carboxylase biotin carboxylase subunit
VQRKNQKLIEETPCSTLNNLTRQAMADAAVRAAKAVGYRGAGTVEFLLDAEGKFYFMEMNTRLQVEHPVTEMATGIDLVKWQIRVAAGLPLGFTQAEVVPSGCAIECRINAEDEAFRPVCGTVNLLHVPGGPWVRFDTAIYQGYAIPPFYDSMIGKLIVHARTRDEAIRKMRSALCELTIEGARHNAEFQHELLSDERFADGSYTTDILERRS